MRYQGIIARYPVARLLVRKIAWILGGVQKRLVHLVESQPVSSISVQSSRSKSGHLALIVGYFSYDNYQATFGDTEAMRVVVEWLEQAAIPFDIACRRVNGMDGLNILTLDPKPYSILIYVCGPWRKGNKMLRKFDHCTKIGVNLSLENPEDNEFDLLLPRDFQGIQNPDVVFMSQVPSLPLAGIAMVHGQPEYGDRQRHDLVTRAVQQYLDRNEVVPVTLDTLHRNNQTAIRNAIEFENIVGRLDVVITTRLHGLVFALKRGIPAVAVDAVTGGAKVTAQAKAVEWPLVINGDDIDAEKIKDAVDLCLSGGMAEAVEKSRKLALARLEHVRTEFMQMLSSLELPKD